jgi:hypothetical protein
MTAGLYGSELPARISQSCLNYSYKDLKKGTCGFSLANKLGQGSNGTVYKVAKRVKLCILVYEKAF